MWFCYWWIGEPIGGNFSERQKQAMKKKMKSGFDVCSILSMLSVFFFSYYFLHTLRSRFCAQICKSWKVDIFCFWFIELEAVFFVFSQFGFPVPSHLFFNFLRLQSSSVTSPLPKKEKCKNCQFGDKDRLIASDFYLYRIPLSLPIDWLIEC